MSYIGKGVETVTFNTATTLDVAGNITLGGTVDGRDVATDGTKLDTITSGAIANILQDTTPQLGGNLDLNTSNIIGTGNINVTGSITGTSFVSTGNMSFTNNSKAIFGTSPSLEIYHDGSNSILDDVGAGNFKMQLAGADKLEITSTGVDVTGSVTADGLTVDGTATINGAAGIPLTLNANSGVNTNLQFNEGGALRWYIRNVTGSNDFNFYGNGASRLNIGSGGDISFYNTSGTAKLSWDASAESLLVTNVGIGGVPSRLLHIRDDDTFTGGSRIVAAFSPSITNAQTAGIAFGAYADDDYWKQGIFWTRTNSYGVGDLHFANRGTTDTTTVSAADAVMTISSAGNVGIGTAATPEKLSIEAPLSTLAGLGLTYSGATKAVFSVLPLTGEVRIGGTAANYFPTFYSSGTERMRIDAAGNVTIQPAGTTTRSFGETVAIKVDQGAPTRLSVRNDSVNATASSGITMSGSGNSWAVECGSSAKNGNALTFAVDATAPTPSIKMRLNTDGRWWVGQAVGTTLGGNGGEAVTGIMHASSATDSYTVIQANGSNSPLYVTRGPNATGNGFIHFGENGAYAGGIGNVGGRIFFADNTQNMGISFYQSSLLPTNINGTAVDNVYDCGHSSYRWDDVWATNGTIQTSDANEKQQIAALTDVEMTAAKAISQLFKTYKWNSAVEAKGDAARTHTGVIAQDVQAAMTAAGLDAGDYAFFISSTWWETQTEVPAVEAVDAVDAVYEDVVIPAVEEELDEDGNVIVEAQPERTEHRLVSEAIRAVEAVAAYTRTDVYDTAEEAPEGATERTRMGIRYPELLAFIGAATEQRLTTIEARIAALENT